jgi:hypothetical protein
MIAHGSARQSAPSSGSGMGRRRGQLRALLVAAADSARRGRGSSIVPGELASHETVRDRVWLLLRDLERSGDMFPR